MLHKAEEGYRVRDRVRECVVPRLRLYPGSGMQDLGTLGGTTSVGYGINKLGQVVGFSITASGLQVAFFYALGAGMLNLNTLLPSASGWRQLTPATGINDNGQITGLCVNAFGQFDAFLLTPVLIPAAIWLLGAGLFGLVGFARRRKS